MNWHLEPIDDQDVPCWAVVDEDGEEMADPDGTVYYCDEQVAQRAADLGQPLRQVFSCACGWRGFFRLEDAGNCPDCGKPAHGTDEWEPWT